jgi:hypothetical protein
VCAVRRTVVLGLVLAALPAVAAADPWDQAVRRAGAYAHARTGSIKFALIDEHGRIRGVRRHVRQYSASLLKPVILGTLLTRPGVRARPLTGAERALLTPMIRWSADAPASTLFVQLGPAAIQRFGRRHGLHSLRVAAPIWGSSLITASSYAQFFSRLPEAIPARHRIFARRLLRTIAGPQRWGVGRVKPPGWTLLFKGGWRAGTGYGRIVNQAARLECHRTIVTLAILTDHDPSHVYGTRTVAGVARRLLAPLRRCRDDRRRYLLRRAPVAQLDRAPAF